MFFFLSSLKPVLSFSKIKMRLCYVLTKPMTFFCFVVDKADDIWLVEITAGDFLYWLTTNPLVLCLFETEADDLFG